MTRPGRAGWLVSATVAAGVLGALLTPAPASGGTFTGYTSLTAWQAAGYTGITTLDFQSTGTGTYWTSLTVGGYTFTPASSWLTAGASAPSTIGSGNYLISLAPALTITLNQTGVYGVGFNLGSFTGGSAAGSIVATAIDGSTYTTLNFATAASGAAAFWGVGSTVELRQIQINYGSTYFTLDNLTSGGQPAPQQGGGGTTPEPATAALVLLGLCGAMCARRRSRARHPRRALRPAQRGARIPQSQTE